MLRNIRSTRRIAAVLTLASTAVLLTGCGSNSAGAGQAVSVATGPQAGTRSQAEAFARQFLTKFVVPTDTRPVQLSSVPRFLRDPWAGPAGSSAPGSADLGQADMVGLPLSVAEAFMLAHEPGGADMTGAGQENGPNGVRDLYIQLDSHSLPKGINDAEAVVLMVPRSAASTLITIYMHVLWFPGRTAAEHLDAANFRAVTVSTVVYGTKLRHVSRMFRSASDIANLTGLLNGFPAAPDAMHTCPSSNTFQISFDPRTADQAQVVVATYGCYAVNITSGGIPQPSLLDSGNAVAVTAARMLGVSS